MDENKSNSSFYDVDDEEGATTVLCAPDADIPESQEESEGATTVLTGPDPVSTGAGGQKPQFSEQTVLVSPQQAGMAPGAVPGPMAPGAAPGPMGSNGMAPNGMMPGAAPGPMGPNGMNGMTPGPVPGPMAPMGPNGMMPGAASGPMGPNGMAPGAMPGPNGMAGNGMVPNNGQMPNVNAKPEKTKKEKKPKTKKEKAPKQPGGKKKKTGLIVALCIVLVLVLGTGAYFLFFTPEKRFERNLAKADKALTNQDYEAAEDAYEAALKIFDDRIVAINGMIKAEIELGEMEDAREDFEKYRAVISAFDATKIEDNREEVVHFYAMAGKLFDDNDKLIEVYGEGWRLTGDAVLQEVLVNAHLERADAIDMADYEEKIEAYTDVLGIDPTNVDALNGRCECAYAVLDDMMVAEQYDEAEAFISNYEDVITEADFSSYSEQIESERELATARHDVMEQTISLMAAGDYEGMLDVDGSENASLVVDNMEGDSYIYAQDGFSSTYTGKAAGVYVCDSGYYFYYGDYENGIRSGQGTLFVKLDGFNGTYEIYEGAWSNDKPNGAGTVSSVNNQTDSGMVTMIETGNFVDGLYDGEISVTLKAEDGDYTGTYTAVNGAVSDVRAEYSQYDFADVPEGRTVYVVLANADETSFWWYSCREGDVLGAYGYGK